MNKKKLLVALSMSGFITGCTGMDGQSIDAKTIALSHAKIDEDSVIGLRVEEDRDYFSKSYEVSFYDDNYEYEYEIDRHGMIMKCDKEMIRYHHDAFSDNQGETITEEQAKAIVFADSGIEAESVKNLRTYVKRHHGIAKIYIKFIHDNRYIEYKLSQNGDVLDVEISKIG